MEPLGGKHGLPPLLPGPTCLTLDQTPQCSSSPALLRDSCNFSSDQAGEFWGAAGRSLGTRQQWTRPWQGQSTAWGVHRVSIPGLGLRCFLMGPSTAKDRVCQEYSMGPRAPGTVPYWALQPPVQSGGKKAGDAAKSGSKWQPDQGSSNSGLVQLLGSLRETH